MNIYDCMVVIRINNNRDYEYVNIKNIDDG
jgi:hypothetical protein